MISIHSKTAYNTISYLNDMYSTDREAYIHILDGYDTVEVNNQVGFGVSHVPENEEMVDWFAIQATKLFKAFQELDLI